jgi:TolC family type I secretion outer membrane protein
MTVRSDSKRVILPLGAALFAFASFEAQAETLFDAMAAAYANNPTLDAQRAQLRATDENVAQAVSGWRPTVTLNGDVGLQRQEINDAGAENRTPANVSVAVSQPIYNGGTTVSQTNSAEANVLAGRENLHATEQTVLLQAVTVYMDVLRDQAVVQLNKNSEQVLQRQLEAAQDRFRVGEITRTDVAQSEARLSRATADRVQAEGQLISSRASYERVVGRAPGELDPPPPLPQLPGSEDESLAIATGENPSLRAAQFFEQASAADVDTASGGLLPTVSLSASVAHAEEPSSAIDETDTAKITANVSVPLYQSGAQYSAVRQARQVNSQRRIQIEENRRAMVESVVQSWEQLMTARARIVSRREQVRANEIALDGVIQEAAVGSRTTLDILDAEQELLDARVALVQAERDEYVAAYLLQSSIGRLTAQKLGLQTDIYDPIEHYQKVRDKWYGTTAD